MTPENLIQRITEEAIEIADEHTDDEIIAIMIEHEKLYKKDFRKLVDEYSVPEENAIKSLALRLAEEQTSFEADKMAPGQIA